MATFIGFRDGVGLDFEIGSSLPFFIFANFFSIKDLQKMIEERILESVKLLFF